jgi:hypothetical protein
VVHHGVFAALAAAQAMVEQQPVVQALVTTVIKVVHGITIAVYVFVFISAMVVQGIMIGVQTTLAQRREAVAQDLLKITVAVGQAKTVCTVYGKAATAALAVEINKNRKRGHSNGDTILFVAIRSVQYGVKQLAQNHVLQLALLDTIGGI